MFLQISRFIYSIICGGDNYYYYAFIYSIIYAIVVIIMINVIIIIWLILTICDLL